MIFISEKVCPFAMLKLHLEEKVLVYIRTSFSFVRVES